MFAFIKQSFPSQISIFDHSSCVLTCLLLNCLAFLPACTGTVKLLYEEIEADGEIIAYSVHLYHIGYRLYSYNSYYFHQPLY